jgi:hypothetical protein
MSFSLGYNYTESGVFKYHAQFRCARVPIEQDEEGRLFVKAEPGWEDATLLPIVSAKENVVYVFNDADVRRQAIQWAIACPSMGSWKEVYDLLKTETLQEMATMMWDLTQKGSQPYKAKRK